MRRGFAEVVLLASLLACTRERTGDVAVRFEDCTLGAASSAERVQAQCTTIDGLRVAVLTAEGGRRATDPLFFIPGGPGQSAGDAFAQVAGAFAMVRRHRDIVVVDPRGTGASEPLRCSNKLPDDLRTTEARERLQSCAREVGERARAITTKNAVHDLDTVRRALGYAVIDVYGASYGTRVALELVRQLPDTVRAVVLDGVIAPESSLGSAQASSTERAFAAVWERCSADEACRGRFADLRLTATRVRNQLSQHPVTLRARNPVSGLRESVVLDDRAFEDTLRGALYQSELVALLPSVIDDAGHDELEGLASLAQLVGASVEQSLNTLVYLSVVCSEDLPFVTVAEETGLFRPHLRELAEACAIWPAAAADPQLKTPVETSVPMLLISGANDPVTPPAEAEKVVAHAKHARAVVLAEQGHIGIVRGCMPRVVSDFLDEASPETLDTSCITRSTALPLFTGPNAP